MNDDQMTVSQYLNKINSLDDDESDFLDKNYKKDILIEHGEILFEVFFLTGKLIKGKKFSNFIQRMIKDGVDWYAGLAFTKNGPLARPDISSREKNPLLELDELLKSKQRNPWITRLIALALPEDLKKEYCKDQANADRLYGVTKEEFIIPFASPVLRRRVLESDMCI